MWKKDEILEELSKMDNFKPERLTKMIGHVTYPKLNEPSVYTKPMQSTPEQATKRVAYTKGSETLKDNTGGWLSARSNKDASKGLPPQKQRVTGVVNTNNTPKAINAIEDHEGQHSIFNQIGQKHGKDARSRVVATSLSKLPVELRSHIHGLFAANNSSAGPRVDPEETITYLHNYLQDPGYRQRLHAKMGLNDVAAQHDSQRKARQAFNMLRDIGSNMNPADVGINLGKSEDKSPLSGIDFSELDGYFGLKKDLEISHPVGWVEGGKKKIMARDLRSGAPIGTHWHTGRAGMKLGADGHAVGATKESHEQ